MTKTLSKTRNMQYFQTKCFVGTQIFLDMEAQMLPPPPNCLSFPDNEIFAHWNDVQITRGIYTTLYMFCVLHSHSYLAIWLLMLMMLMWYVFAVASVLKRIMFSWKHSIMAQKSYWGMMNFVPNTALFAIMQLPLVKIWETLYNHYKSIGRCECNW